VTTLAHSARAVAAVIQALDLENVTLVLHDTGCPPALAAAARTPNRIRGIVGVNTFAWKPAGRAFRGMLAVMGSPAVRRIDLATGVLARLTSTAFGVGRHLDETSRGAYRAGLAGSMGAFHDYLGEARFSDEIYNEVTRALTGPFRSLPLLTIFGQRNDPLGFQPQWKRLFPNCRQITIPAITSRCAIPPTLWPTLFAHGTTTCRPEVVLLTLSLVAIVLERRRRQQGSGPHRRDVLQPALSRY
jgi:pimeloyl-ACP methyl ester carboxylesterase